MNVHDVGVELDPVDYEIIRANLQSVPDLVETDLTRTAFSPLITEYKDYAVGVVDSEGRSVVQATSGLPLFLANISGRAVRSGMELFGEENIHPGDVIITNHNEILGQHLNNVVMYTPVHDEAGVLKLFMSVIFHWIDVGGMYPGSSSGTDMTELIQEGMHIPTVKLYEKGQPREDIFRIIEGNTRQPDLLRGDVAAQYAGCMKGKSLLDEILRRHGIRRLEAAISRSWNDAEQQARQAIVAAADGRYEAESFLDGDGVSDTQGVPIKVAVEISGSDVTVDFSGVAGQLKGPFNSGRYGGAESCARLAFRYLFAWKEPPNEGTFAPLTVEIPDGTFLSAGPGAPMARYSTPLPTVIDTILRAVAPALPHVKVAGHHGALNAYGFNGVSPRTGRFFSYFDTTHGGWGAGADSDGTGPFKTMVHADNKDIPMEVQEALYPVRVDRFVWRKNSGGAGHHRGAPGLEKVYRVLAPCNGYVSFERSKCAPWGIEGGDDGACADAIFEIDGERQQRLKASRVPMQEGDTLTVLSGGGGGNGDPFEREPQAVADDFIDGLITLDHARDVYGVVMGEGGEVDHEATKKVRQESRRN